MNDGFSKSHSFLTNCNPSFVRSSDVFANTGSSAFNSLLNNNFTSSSHTLSTAFNSNHLNSVRIQEPANSVNRIANDLLKLHKSTSDIRQSASIASTRTSTNNFSYFNPQSEIETAILKSTEPIEIAETEEISALGYRGIWVNKSESKNWRGPIPLSKYELNQDNNPELMTKKSKQRIEYVQELAIRYLRPPTPPAPGEIIIQQLSGSVYPPAPPLIIRQQPARPTTPEPLVIREVPPKPPHQIGRKVITIAAKNVPPPPRKVVIERLAPLPAKPQSVIIERWLPYNDVKRKVIFQKKNDQESIVSKPKNVIIQWQTPDVQIKKEFKYLGVIKANPIEYKERYGTTLKNYNELPEFVLEIKPPQGVVLAADKTQLDVPELEGDVEKLNYIDLEKEGLEEYRHNIDKWRRDREDNSLTYRDNPIYSYLNESSASISPSYYIQNPQTETITDQAYEKAIDFAIDQLFRAVDRNNNGRINFEDAERTLLRLNNRLNREYDEEDVRNFFSGLDIDNDGTLNLNEFKSAFLNLALF